MRSQHIMFLAILFAAGTFISMALTGEWMDSGHVETLNSLTVFRNVSFFGLFTIMVPNLDYFSTGMKNLIQFDFAFFGGTLEIVKFLFQLVIGAATIWGIYTIIIAVATSLFRR